MASLYYNAAVDTAWDTLGNWWDDAAFTSPALALPADGDDVYLGANITSGPSTSVTLNHIYVADASTGGGNFGVNFTGAIGDATFNDDSFNAGIVTGDATFNDVSYNDGGTVLGDATFNSYSSNYGPVTGNATFNDDSYNAGTVTGDATFNDDSFNAGIVTGDATYNPGLTGYNNIAGPIYYVGGRSTTLDSNGSGFWDNKAYYNGSEQPTGWNGYFYYINNVETTLPESGTGFWDPTYYVGGTATSLPESGTGTWEGNEYVNGLIKIRLYIRTDGNDTTGDGSLGAPFATAQKGFETAYANSSPFILDLGEGSFGGVSLATANAIEWPVRIEVRGVSTSASNLGGIAITADRPTVTIISNNSINIGDISYSYISGGSGGIVSLTNCTAGNIDTAYIPGGGVSLNNSTAGNINTAGYSGGSVILTNNSSAGNIYTAGLLSSGSITITNSTAGYLQVGDYNPGLGELRLNGTYSVGGIAFATIYIDDILTPLYPNGGGWWADNNAYYIKAKQTTLPESGTGSWGGGYYFGGCLTPLDENGTGFSQYISGLPYCDGFGPTRYFINASVVTGWYNPTGEGYAYYVGGMATSLPESGTGWAVRPWQNNEYAYFIAGVETTLPESGTGWFAPTYYIGGAATPLNENGNGFIGEQEYRNGEPYNPPDPCAGFQPGTGWLAADQCGFLSGYYIDNTRTDLDQSGTGGWDGNYWFNGQRTSLDSNGNGTWDGKIYLNGLLVNALISGKYYTNGLLSTTFYYINTNSGQLWSNTNNWNTLPEGGGVLPIAPPWTEPTTNSMNLGLGQGAAVPKLSGMFIGMNGIISGRCHNSIAAEIISNGYDVIKSIGL